MTTPRTPTPLTCTAPVEDDHDTETYGTYIVNSHAKTILLLGTCRPMKIFMIR